MIAPEILKSFQQVIQHFGFAGALRRVGLCDERALSLDEGLSAQSTLPRCWPRGVPTGPLRLPQWMNPEGFSVLIASRSWVMR